MSDKKKFGGTAEEFTIVDIEINMLPLPAVLFSSTLEVKQVNSEYEEAFGALVQARHLEGLQTALANGQVSPYRMSTLPSGDHLVLFDPQLEELQRRDRVIREATHMAKVGGWELYHRRRVSLFGPMRSMIFTRSLEASLWALSTRWPSIRTTPKDGSLLIWNARSKKAKSTTLNSLS